MRRAARRLAFTCVQFSHKEEEKKQEVYFSAIDGLKKLYKSKILPVEELYKYNITSPPLRSRFAAGGMDLQLH